MSSHFNANQYEDAFIPHRLKNWEVPKGYRETQPGYEVKQPRSYQGCTEVIGTDRGHLMDSAPRSTTNPWGDFVGTWDLPKQIPGQRFHNPTARSADAQQRLTHSAREAARVLNGTDKNVKRQAAQAVRLGEPLSLSPIGKARKDTVYIAEPEVADRRSGADAPVSKMIPTSNSPGSTDSPIFPETPSPGSSPSGLSPKAIPATPDEIKKIPTPGLGECVTPPQNPPMVIGGRRIVTPDLNRITTPQVRTPDLGGFTPKQISPKPMSPPAEGNLYEPELMVE